MEQRHFCQASLEYVFLLQEVQERKKFEFVETVSYFIFSNLSDVSNSIQLTSLKNKIIFIMLK